MTTPAADTPPPESSGPPPAPPADPSPPVLADSEDGIPLSISPRPAEALAGPLPGESAAVPTAPSVDTSIPLATPREPPARSILPAARRPPAPRLADQPMWPTSEEVTGRRWLVA